MAGFGSGIGGRTLVANFEMAEVIPEKAVDILLIVLF